MRWAKDRLWERFAWGLWLYAVLVIGLVLRRFASAQLIAGWDLLPHYYLLQSMVSQLHQLRLSSYDPHWFAGYPAFTFYPPLTYLVAALPSLASAGAVPPSLTLNFLVVILPFLFLYSIYSVTAVMFDRRAAVCSLFFGLPFLLGESDHLLAPFGIYGSLVHGNLNAFIGVILVLVLLQLLVQLQRSFSPSRFIGAAITAAALVLTHTLSALFAAALTLCFVAFYGRRAAGVAAATAIVSLAATAFWWIPFSGNLGYTSGTIIGQSWLDPLAAMLPDLDLIRKCAYAPSWPILLRLPVVSLVLFICASVGIVALFRRRDYFLPASFLILLILLPRNILPHVLAAPLHYYRFIMPLFPLLLILASHGAVLCIEAAALTRTEFARRFASLAVGGAVFWSLLNLGIKDYGPEINRLPGYSSLYYSAARACGAEPFPPFPITLGETPAFKPATAMLNYIVGEEPSGRVASETAGTDNLLIGSPHFFTTLLPMIGGVDTLPGLLVESSYSSEFFTSTLGYLSYAVRWGRDQISRYFVIQNPDISLEGMIYRLRLWSVEFLIASSKHYQRELDALKSRQIEKTFSAGPFSAYRLNNPFPRVRRLHYRPYLFIELGGMDFRSFAEQWYISDRMLASPVIYTEKSFEQLPSHEQAEVGGFILSVPGGFAQPATRILPWLNYDKPVVVVGDAGLFRNEQERWIARADDYLPITLADGSAGLLFRGQLAEQKLYRALPEFIERAVPISPKKTAVNFVYEPDDRIIFEQSGGILINYSYFPRWKSRNSEQTVFIATPSTMYVVSRGRTELYYE